MVLNENREPAFDCPECGGLVLENSYGEWICTDCTNDCTEWRLFNEEDGSD